MLAGFTLDVRTLLLVNSLTIAALALAITYVRFTRRVYPGFGYWTLMQWMWMTGFVLLSLRDKIPDWASIPLANVLICGTYVMLLCGLRRFFDRGTVYRHGEWGLALLTALAFGWFYLVNESTNARSLIVTTFYLAISWQTFALLFSLPHWRHSAALVSLMSALGLLTLLNLLRFGFLLFNLAQTDSHLHHDPSMAAMTLFLPMVSIFMVFSYIQLTYERTELDLKQAEQRAQELARRDVLTNTWNRRHAEETAQREVTRARRGGQPLSLILLDIDHFKSINDCYGHLVGDEALKAVAAECQQTVRAEDVVARWGGEEFLILLPDTGLQGASELAERLRHALSLLIIDVADQQPPPRITASLGVVCLSPDESFEELVARADKALYLAKDAGRNRVVATNADDLPPNPHTTLPTPQPA